MLLGLDDPRPLGRSAGYERADSGVVEAQRPAACRRRPASGTQAARAGSRSCLDRTREPVTCLCRKWAGSVTSSAQLRTTRARRRSAARRRRRTAGRGSACARVVAGLVIPQRNRARCRGVAERLRVRRARARASAAASTSVSSGGVGSASGSRCAAPVEAEAAVPARLAARLAEVADERVHLAAVVRDELDDARDALRLGPLAALEPRRRARSSSSAREPGRASRCSAGAPRPPSARRGRAARGSSSAATIRLALLAERGRGRVGIDASSRRAPVLPLATSAAQEVARGRRRTRAKTSSNEPPVGRTP